MTNKFFALLLIFLAFACDQKVECNKTCVNVKLIKELCGQAILEIQDPAYYDYGQTWQDGAGVVYGNVFLTLLPCNFSDNFGNGSGVLQPGQEFNVQFTDSMLDDECARCKALLDGPEKFNYIKIQSDCDQDE